MLLAGPAAAVIGGREDSGPLASATVMVLNSRGGLCSAVVVARDAILTAGHCVAGTIEIRVHYRDGAAAPVMLTPASRALHPGYRADAVAARRASIDLALLRLAEPLPARFAVAALSGAAPSSGVRLTLGGYGLAREGDDRSTGTFRSAQLAVIEPHGRSRILVWASDPAKAGAGACEGDSGGPVARAGDSAVFAITSWASGAGRAACGEVSQAVLVGPQRAWIDATLAGWGRSAGWR
jgi:hypothetical protein